jgi:hypothetical protein
MRQLPFLQVLQAGQISIKSEVSAAAMTPAPPSHPDDAVATPPAIDPESTAARILTLLGAQSASSLHKDKSKSHGCSFSLDASGFLISPPQHLALYPLDNRDPVVCISAGSFHAGCVTRDGIIYTWGDGDRGQLGNGKLSSAFAPTAVSSLAGLHIQSVSCGFWHSMCLVRPNDGKGSPSQANANSNSISEVAHDDWIVLRENMLFSTRMWCCVRKGFMLLYNRKDAATPKTVIFLL